MFGADSADSAAKRVIRELTRDRARNKFLASECGSRAEGILDNEAHFWKVQRGELPPPKAFRTLGGRIVAVDIEGMTVRTEFEAKGEFTNPAGTIQGGFLSAMLDDTLGPALAATLGAGEFVATLSLNVNFLRAALPGAIAGCGRVESRGRKICHLSGELSQFGRVVATATAVAFIGAAL